ncbi:MAG: hypothetical protein AAF203_07990, partial [Pseudomonadota bacterium]
MVILPLGLVSKTKNIPIATILIAVVTVYYSITNFALNDRANEIYWHAESRTTFAKQAKQWLIKNCENKQAKTYCEGLETVPPKAFLLAEKAVQLKTKDTPDPHHYDYIAEELSIENLKINNPELYQSYLAAQASLKKFVTENDLLSSHHITWKSNLRAIFLHGGYLHLLGNLLILIFLAFPV